MLHSLNLAGSHHEVGLALGRFGAQALHAYSNKSALWHHVMGFRDSEQLAAMQRAVMSEQPKHWLELEGLAQGLEMPLSDVFAWQCRGDLMASTHDGCTTIARPWPEPLIAHNEDGDPLFAGQCAIAQIKTDDELAFTAFVYPGSLPGHTFAVNAAGLCLTVNNLRPKHVGIGLPRMLLARALVTQPSIDRALDYLDAARRSGAFHFTLAQAGDARLLSIEFTSTHCSVVDVQETTGHTNHMTHRDLAQLPQIVTDSSYWREQQLLACLAKQPTIEPMTILFDTEHPQLPIFRQQPDDPDGENTLASARFEIRQSQVHWQVYDPRSRDVDSRWVNERAASA